MTRQELVDNLIFYDGIFGGVYVGIPNPKEKNLCDYHRRLTNNEIYGIVEYYNKHKNEQGDLDDTM